MLATPSRQPRLLRHPPGLGGGGGVLAGPGQRLGVLLAIKRLGGVAIVQDPHEALYPSMPLSALEHVVVDYKLPVSEIGPLIVSLTRELMDKEGDYFVPEDMEIEVRMAEMDIGALDGNMKAGTPL